MRALIKTHGGKRYSASWIVSNFPAGYEGMVFVEVFCGGGNVLLTKNPSRAEFVNDADRGVMRLFRVVRDECDRFADAVEDTPYEEGQFLAAKRALERHEARIRLSLPGELTEFSQAVNEYVVRRMSRGGMRKNFAWSERKRGGIPGDANAWRTMLGELPAISRRLRGVVVSEKDFGEVIPLFDDRNVLMYLDPPYLHETRVSRRVYAHEMDRTSHERMLDLCVKSSAKIIISGYASGLYGERLAEWVREEKEVANHSSQAAKKGRKTEILWKNY